MSRREIHQEKRERLQKKGRWIGKKAKKNSLGERMSKGSSHKKARKRREVE